MPRSGRDSTSGTSERTAQRDGCRTRAWDTRLGTLELPIPKLRTGSYFPSWLEPRRRTEQALTAVIAEAYVQEVSTRKVEAFRTRRLDAEYPYLWGDARYEHVREGGRVVSMAFVAAYGVRADGVRGVLGFAVALSEDLATWREVLQSLVARGLRGSNWSPDPRIR